MIWATANSNLALVKYWGKAPGNANQAASASLSVALGGLSTVAGVEFGGGLGTDTVDWAPGAPSQAVTRFLDEVRQAYGIRLSARVVLRSNFPLAAGLASSASTFAALATAAVAAAGRSLPEAELASLARRGSGSACRSIPGGFVEWVPGRANREVTRIAPPDHWPLAILVAITSEERKPVGSREGMERTAATSPYYAGWLAQAKDDLPVARRAVLERDLAILGKLAERNCLRMHAAAIGADPPLLYWRPATLAVIERVWELRRSGIEAYFTIDAGPQVKVLCEPSARAIVKGALDEVPGVLRILESSPGGGALVLAERPSEVAA